MRDNAFFCPPVCRSESGRAALHYWTVTAILYSAVRENKQQLKIHNPAKRSVARIRPSRTPGSLNKWPPSGIRLSSTSGHACLSVRAAVGGAQVRCRPGRFAPGTPRSVAAGTLKEAWPEVELNL